MCDRAPTSKLPWASLDNMSELTEMATGRLNSCYGPHSCENTDTKDAKFGPVSDGLSRPDNARIPKREAAVKCVLNIYSSVHGLTDLTTESTDYIH